MNSNELSIVFEDSQILVVNKPAGLMVEPDRAGNPNLNDRVVQYLKSTSRKEVFLHNVHRLDRPASGIVLFAKKRSALKILSEQFEKRQVKKNYFAITVNSPEKKQGKLINYLIKDEMAKKAVVSDKEVKDSKKAELIYSVKETKESFFLWEIELLTGRYHQVRAQLSHLGCPIVGDVLYGSSSSYFPKQLCLHATRLMIVHPVTSEQLQFEAPFPDNVPWNKFK